MKTIIFYAKLTNLVWVLTALCGALWIAIDEPFLYVGELSVNSLGWIAFSLCIPAIFNAVVRLYLSTERYFSYRRLMRAHYDRAFFRQKLINALDRFYGTPTPLDSDDEMDVADAYFVTTAGSFLLLMFLAVAAGIHLQIFVLTAVTFYVLFLRVRYGAEFFYSR